MWRRMGRAIAFVLIAAGAAVANPAGAADPPDQPSILFGTDRHGNDEVYMIDGSDGSLVNLTNDPASDTSPSWSPDGSRIAFVSDRNGNPDIWIMDADGSILGNATTSPDHESGPVWSPDGMRIAYSASLEVRHPDGSRETVMKPSIFVFDLRTGDRIRLTIPDPTLPGTGDWARDAGDSQPGWSPDGENIAFVRHYTGPTPTAQTTALFIVGAGGGETPAYVGNGGWGVHGLDWLSDGDWILWSNGGLHGLSAQLRRVHLTSGTVEDVEVPLDFGNYVQPSVSTDGTTVVFAAYTINKDRADLYSWRLDGKTELVQLTSDPEWDTDPVWQSWYPPIGLMDTTTGLWMLRQGGMVDEFYFGDPGDYPFVGDWDCDGIDTPGLYRQSDGYVYLRNTNTQGNADISFFFGDPGDVPISGDFSGDGCDTVSIYRPTEARFYIINELGTDGGGLGAAEYSFLFGDIGDQPVVGNWDGDAPDEIGLHRDTTGLFYYRNSLTTGTADGQFFLGDPGDRFVSGDWGDSDGDDTPAAYRPSDTTFYFRDTLTQGKADSQYTWAGARANWLPIAGNFWG